MTVNLHMGGLKKELVLRGVGHHINRHIGGLKRVKIFH